MKIRADDPLSMKNFILGVQSRVNELKASAGEGQKKINNKRVSEFIYVLSLEISLFSASRTRYNLLGGNCRWSSCLKRYVT